MDAVSRVKKQQSSAIPGSRSVAGFAASLLLGMLWSQSTAGDPLSESLRGGAGTPVVEIPEVREQNLRADPKYRKYAEGLYVLEMFSTLSADKSYRVSVWNLLVGPARETQEFELPGAAILLLRAGSAQVVLGDQKESDLKMGATLVAPEKASIRITNRSPDRPVTIRATLFSGAD